MCFHICGQKICFDREHVGSMLSVPNPAALPALHTASNNCHTHDDAPRRDEAIPDVTPAEADQAIVLRQIRCVPPHKDASLAAMLVVHVNVEIVGIVKITNGMCLRRCRRNEGGCNYQGCNRQKPAYHRLHPFSPFGFEGGQRPQLRLLLLYTI